MLRTTSQSTMWPFGLFALLGFRVGPFDSVAGWIGFVAVELGF